MRRKKLNVMSSGAQGQGGSGSGLNFTLTGEGAVAPELFGLQITVTEPNTTVTFPFTVHNDEFSSFPVSDMNLEWGDDSSETISLTYSDMDDLPYENIFFDNTGDYGVKLSPTDSRYYQFFTNTFYNKQNNATNPYLSTDSELPNAFRSERFPRYNISDNSVSNTFVYAIADDTFRIGRASLGDFGYDEVNTSSGTGTGAGLWSNYPYYSINQIANHQYRTNAFDVGWGTAAQEDTVLTPAFSYNRYKSIHYGGDGINDYYFTYFSVQHTYAQPGTYYIHPAFESDGSEGVEFQRTWNRVNWNFFRYILFEPHNKTGGPGAGWYVNGLHTLPTDPNVDGGIAEMMLIKPSEFENKFSISNPRNGSSSYFRIPFNSALYLRENVPSSELPDSYGINLSSTDVYLRLNTRAEQFLGDTRPTFKITGDPSGLKNLYIDYIFRVDLSDVDMTTCAPVAVSFNNLYESWVTTNDFISKVDKLLDIDFSNCQSADGLKGLMQAIYYRLAVGLSTESEMNPLMAKFGSRNVGKNIKFNFMFSSLSSTDISSSAIGSWSIGSGVPALNRSIFNGNNKNNGPTDYRVKSSGNSLPQTGINMAGMFFLSTGAIPDITSWNTSKVYNMSEMFKSNTSFNQDLSSWDFTGLMNGDRVNITDPAVPSYNYPRDQNPWNHNPLYEIFRNCPMDAQYINDILVKWKDDAYAANLAEGIDVAGGATPQYMINQELMNQGPWTTVVESQLSSNGVAAITTLESVFGWEITMPQ